MKILFTLLLSVGLVWALDSQPQPGLNPKEDVITGYVGTKVLKVKNPVQKDSNNTKTIGLNVPDESEKKPASRTTTEPVSENHVPIDLSERLFYANYYDSQFNFKTLDLSGLDLSGDDVKRILYSLNSTVLPHVARLDLSHNRIWELPARVWPLDLEYSLRELRFDHNRLHLSDTIDTRTTRFEITRLRSLKKLSLSHCVLSSSLGLMEFPPIESLDLSGNWLVELPSSLATLKTLRHLDASGNRLRYLNSFPLTSLSDLQTLNLSNNGLEKMWDDPLQELYSLETLHLEQNILSEFPKLYQFKGSYQPKLNLYISGNAFKCGCSFSNSLTDSRVQIIDKANLTCVDKEGVELSAGDVSTNRCFLHLENVKDKMTGAWQRSWQWLCSLDWSSVNWLLWILLGILTFFTISYGYRNWRAARAEVPYTGFSVDIQ